jgi:RNA 3'-terminal phosphate cyclase (ATP)
VQAAIEICGAKCDGAYLGSTALTYEPGRVTASDYHFAIGSAAASCLVFQTVFLPLTKLNAPSRVTILDGTHNTMAPSFEYLDRVFLPPAKLMGFDATPHTITNTAIIENFSPSKFQSKNPAGNCVCSR